MRRSGWYLQTYEQMATSQLKRFTPNPVHTPLPAHILLPAHIPLPSSPSTHLPGHTWCQWWHKSHHVGEPGFLPCLQIPSLEALFLELLLGPTVFNLDLIHVNNPGYNEDIGVLHWQGLLYIRDKLFSNTIGYALQYVHTR